VHAGRLRLRGRAWCAGCCPNATRGPLLRPPECVAPLLRPGGRLLLREFHPASTKLLALPPGGGRKRVTLADYFSPSLAAVPVAFSKYAAEGAAGGGGGGGAQQPGSQSDRAAGRSEGRGAAPTGAAGAAGGRTLLRRWSLGEVVNAVAGGRGGGLRLLLLDEAPGVRLDEAGMPKLFTLMAEKPS
jgi:hypothetical protein